MNAANNLELLEHAQPLGEQDDWFEQVETAPGIALVDDDAAEITLVVRTPAAPAGHAGTVSSRLGLCLLAVVAIGGMLAAAFAGTLTTF